MTPTQEQVIAWAREAGAEVTDWIDKCFGEDMVLFDKEQLEAAMNLAYEAGRKDENEACAKVCDELVTHTQARGDNDAMLAAFSCAAAIRARG